MTVKKIQPSSVLGNKFYVYELSSSNYTPALNASITITCKCTNVYGENVASKSLTLYQNGTSQGAKTTNSNGVATWTITCSNGGLQKFSIGDTSIDVFVDTKSENTHTHGNLSNDGKISQTSSATMLYFTGVGATANTLYKSNKLDADCIVDDTAYTNIGSSANDTQSTINSKIDAALANVSNSNANIDMVTSSTGFSSTLTDTKVPSEKLIKEYVDGLIEDIQDYIYE